MSDKMNQFQLFPSPSPEVNRSNNPFRKPGKRPALKAEPHSPIPLQEIKNPANTESLLLQIIEDTQTIPSPTENVGKTKKSPVVGGISHDSRSPQSMHSQNRQKRSNHQALPSHGSHGSSSSSQTAASTVSPQSSQSSVSPVPMRSMFPQFDPNLPVDQQAYHPQAPTVLQLPPPPKKTRKPPKLTLSTGTEIDHVLGPKTVPASIFNFPTGPLEPEVGYSSTEEMKMLWDIANGQRRDFGGMLNLRMMKTGPATFTLGNHQQPFYTLQTYSTDELSLSRSDPSQANNEVPIMMMSLEDRIRREHPNDGLVTLLFSRLAAMLAIDQAEGISKQYHLSPPEAAEVETDALKRAAAQESCRLSWNRHQRHYELRHPSLSRRHPPALVGAAGIPLSPVRSQSSGMVHITVSTPSSHTSSRQPPTIIVTGPSSAALEAAQQAANPRTSTLPVTDHDEPLATLDFGTKTLSISPAAVVATIPSLYAIDSLIAAMLAVAVSDEATNPILADMALGSPEPSRPPTSQTPSQNQYSMPVFQGKLVTTIAEREDAAQSMNLASQIKSAQKSKPRSSVFKFWNREPSNPSQLPKSNPNPSSKKQKNQKIVVEEFDLEKYGRYGKGSREGKKLPGVTRGVLRVLFFGLDMIVKGLTLIVKILAWLLVRSTRCVTSEKF